MIKGTASGKTLPEKPQLGTKGQKQERMLTDKNQKVQEHDGDKKV